MDVGGRGVPHPSIALNCGECVPTFGGGVRGGACGSSLKNTFYLCRGDYVSIYNWPQSGWLKRGQCPPQVGNQSLEQRVRARVPTHSIPYCVLGTGTCTLDGNHKGQRGLHDTW